MSDSYTFFYGRSDAKQEKSNETVVSAPEGYQPYSMVLDLPPTYGAYKVLSEDNFNSRQGPPPLQKVKRGRCGLFIDWNGEFQQALEEKPQVRILYLCLLFL
jgi:hypothetical protein